MMEMSENRRLREIDDETLGGTRDDGDFDEYEFYSRWFAQEQLDGLLESVRRKHEDIWLAFLRELQSAVELLYRSLDDDARIGGYLRGYRAVDSYDMALTHTVVEAFAAPFAKLFNKPIKPWAFFHREVLEGIRARAFDDAFGGEEVRAAIASFYGLHRGVRNGVVHGTKIPTHDEFRAMLIAAKGVYDLADQALHGKGASHVPILDADNYDHDDFRTTKVF